MSIREEFEKREKRFISPFGSLSSESRGRLKAEAPCPVRTAFQMDRDRIVYSNAFRRLKHKTQVFLSPLGDHYRTRLTHTLEVAQIARNISRGLFLNEDLAEVIALGHDLGHPPFGHSGETALKEIYSPSFSHNEQSLRVVDILENRGQGLNLTHEVRDGILKHSKGYGRIISDDASEMASTLEGQIVRIADIMAYLNHDLDDAIRSGVITDTQVPQACIQVLGRTHSKRAATLIRDVIFSSDVCGERICLQLSDDVHGAMTCLREFLYDNVYRSERVHNEFVKAKKILSELFVYFLENKSLLYQELDRMGLGDFSPDGSPNNTDERLVCDFVASLTDRHAMDLYTTLFFPSPQF